MIGDLKKRILIKKKFQNIQGKYFYNVIEIDRAFLMKKNFGMLYAYFSKSNIIINIIFKL